MTGLTRRVTESDRLRRFAIPAYRVYARAAFFYPPPRVLATSMPKAGTHLLASLLANFPRMMFSGRHYAFRNFRDSDGLDSGDTKEAPGDIAWDRVERALGSLRYGQYMTAHFAPLPELVALLEKLDYRTLVMLRDPRDVAVSSSFYLAHLQRHFLHDRFTTEFSTTDERLMAVIVGFSGKAEGRGLPSVGDRLQRYKQWLEQPNASITRFEKLVGPNGGGSEEEQRQEVMAIGRYINRPMTYEQADRLATKTWSPRSSTFRKGTIGDWQNHFADRHKEAFKEVAGASLIELGYENDYDW